MGYRNYFKDKRNPIRIQNMNQKNRVQNTESTPMSFNAGQSRRQAYANLDDESLIDWD